MNQLDFKGRAAIVTGGAQGIGLAIVRRLIASGAKVRIWDHDQKLLAKTAAALGAAVSGDAVDVTDQAAVERGTRTALETLGQIDVFVNNAGIAGPTGGVAEIAPADWRRTLDVNITGMFLCTRLAVPLLRKAEEPAIINLSSVAGRLGYAYRTPYAASKWAVVGFTSSLAKELGPEGIRVNALLPGVVRGERIERVFAERARTLGVPVEEVRQGYLQKVSLRRMVEPEDMAAMALFLCSPAGRHVHGQALSICGNVETI